MQEAVLRVFADGAVLSKIRRCRISTRSTCSKKNLIVHFQSLSYVSSQ